MTTRKPPTSAKLLCSEHRRRLVERRDKATGLWHWGCPIFKCTYTYPVDRILREAGALPLPGMEGI